MADVLDTLRGCPDCGLFSHMPEAEGGTSVHCPRCLKSFRRVRSRPYDYLLVCIVSALIFCIIFITAPFINTTLYGRFQVSTLWTGPETLDHQGLGILAMVVLLTTIFLPFARLALMSITLIGIRLRLSSHFIKHAFRWTKRISSWAMLEVYMLGSLVAYTRLRQMTFVQIDTAMYALICAILFTAIAESVMDREDIWRRIRKYASTQKELDSGEGELISCHTCLQVSRYTQGTKCPRCEDTLHPRKKHSIERAWAFMIAGVILYFPANYFPVMNLTQFGRTYSYTIFGGMMEFVHSGLWPLALLVFIASIAIPFLKLASLFYMLIATHMNSGNNLLARTRLYRIIHFIGRWSMVDIFMASIMVALVQFGQIAHITSGMGAVCFAAVVILTMLAVESFDTRLMWDRNRFA